MCFHVVMTISENWTAEMLAFNICSLNFFMDLTAFYGGSNIFIFIKSLQTVIFAHSCPNFSIPVLDTTFSFALSQDFFVR